MKKSAKHLTDPPTKSGSIEFLRELIAHIENGVVTIDEAHIDYDVLRPIGAEQDAAEPNLGSRFRVRLEARDHLMEGGKG